jgi:hypothetical protein
MTCVGQAVARSQPGLPLGAFAQTGAPKVPSSRVTSIDTDYVDTYYQVERTLRSSEAPSDYQAFVILGRANAPGLARYLGATVRCSPQFFGERVQSR